MQLGGLPNTKGSCPSFSDQDEQIAQVQAAREDIVHVYRSDTFVHLIT